MPLLMPSFASSSPHLLSRSWRALLPALIGAAVAVPAVDAHAGGVGDAFAAAGLGVGAVGIVDIGFLAYDVSLVGDDDEPDDGAMIAQTAVWAPQMALIDAVVVVGQVDREHGAVLTLAGLIPAVFATGMTTFGAWSLANKDVPVGPRFGVSFMVGANFVLSAGAITSAFVADHVAAPWLSIPEIAIGAAQAVPSFVQAARDPDHRAAWIGLGAWSTAILAHGTVSAVVAANAPPPDSKDEQTEKPKTASSVRPVIAPTVFFEGKRSLPGVVVVGAF